MIFNDVEEYFAFSGFKDRAFNKKRRKLPAKYQLIYDLAYDLEEVSLLLFLDLERRSPGTVVEWEEPSGWGVLLLDNGVRVKFNYLNIPDSDWIYLNDKFLVVYKPCFEHTYQVVRLYRS
ncbi:MAG: hypothetical protein FMNOHCHN_03797 [Ignavibacteriaceae bacterium]|nr:hypothetical protein [Ignavibacteriaceae bacterium]